jgi:hypothetical protein
MGSKYGLPLYYYYYYKVEAKKKKKNIIQIKHEYQSYNLEIKTVKICKDGIEEGMESDRRAC